MNSDEKIAFLKQKYDEVCAIRDKQLSFNEKFIYEIQKDVYETAGIRADLDNDCSDKSVVYTNRMFIASLDSVLSKIKQHIYKIKNKQLDEELGF